MREREEFYTPEERREPVWTGCEHFQFNTSRDPKVLGVHVSPWGSDAAYEPQNINHLANDIVVFTMDWVYKNLHRMNGFQAGRYKWVFHSAGWTPEMGYDKMIVDMKLSKVLSEKV